MCACVHSQTHPGMQAHKHPQLSTDGRPENNMCMLRSLTPTQDSSAGVPIFVFLSPGVDVAGSVEALGRKLGYTGDAGVWGQR
eukprot:1161047-Pelagomonas_calceolata.AAC.55